MKKLVICIMALVLILSFCACGKKAESKRGTAGDDVSSSNEVSSSIIIEEDTIDGSISLDDIEDLPELENVVCSS